MPRLIASIRAGAKAKVAAFSAQPRTGRFAVVKRGFKGAVTRWQTGEVVRAYFVRGSWWSISRLRWRKPHLPLANSCVVTRDMLTLGAEIPAEDIPSWDRR